MGDDEEKGEYDTRINKARPVNNTHRELENESTRRGRPHLNKKENDD